MKRHREDECMTRAVSKTADNIAATSQSHDRSAAHASSITGVGAATTQSTPSFVRVFEHVEGNWPSHIRINVGQEGGLPVAVGKIAHAAIQDIQAKLESHRGHAHQHESNDTASYAVPLQIVQETLPHISLSKPFVLRQHYIDAFVGALQRSLSCRISKHERHTVDLQPAYNVLANDTETRAFVCIPITDRADILKRLLVAVDEVLTEFKQPTYYEDPKFHVSVASMRINDLATDLPSELLLAKHESISVIPSVTSTSASVSTSSGVSVRDEGSYNTGGEEDDIDNDDDDSDDDFRKHVVFISADEDDFGDDDCGRSIVNEYSGGCPSSTTVAANPHVFRSHAEKGVRLPLSHIECKVGNRNFLYDMFSQEIKEVK
jgi:Uncharacterised conserved protein